MSERGTPVEVDVDIRASAVWKLPSSVRRDDSGRFESLILSHHSGFSVTCECNEEAINDE